VNISFINSNARAGVILKKIHYETVKVSKRSFFTELIKGIINWKKGAVTAPFLSCWLKVSLLPMLIN
jgi:hypothetical protein